MGKYSTMLPCLSIYMVLSVMVCEKAHEYLVVAL
jgi:hypothetical protein